MPYAIPLLEMGVASGASAFTIIAGPPAETNEMLYVNATGVHVAARAPNWVTFSLNTLTSTAFVAPSITGGPAPVLFATGTYNVITA